MAISEELLIKVSVDSTGVVGGIKVVDKNLKKLNKTNKDALTINKAVSQSWSKLNANIVATNQAVELASRVFRGLAATARQVVTPFADFETALVGVGKTTNIAGAELEGFGDRITDLSEKIPVSANELLDIAKVAGQLGVTGVDNLELFAETIAKVGVATDLAGEEAATAFTRILNVTEEPISRIAEFSSVVVALGNNFAASESEITRVATEVARSTSQFRIGADNVAGLSTALRSLGIQAQLGGSVVGKAFREIDNAIRGGGESFRALEELTGLVGEELEETFRTDATAVFQSFLNGLARIDKAGGSVSAALEQFKLKGDEVSKVLPVLAGRADLVADALELVAENSGTTAALNREAAKAFDTLASDIQLTQNALNNFFKRIGQGLAEDARAFLRWVRQSVNALPELTDEIEILTKSIAALGATIAALKVGALVAALGGAGKAALRLGNVLVRFKALALAIFAPIGKAIALITIPLFILIDNWEVLFNVVRQGREVFNALFNSFGARFNSMLLSLTEAVRLTKEWLGVADKDASVQVDRFRLALEENNAEIDKSIEKIKELSEENQKTFDASIVGGWLNELFGLNKELERTGTIFDEVAQRQGDPFIPQEVPDFGAVPQFTPDETAPVGPFKEVEQLNQLLEKQKDAIKAITEENRNLKNEQRTASLQGLDLLREQLKVDLETVKVLEQKAEAEGLTTPELTRQFGIRRQILRTTAEAARKEMELAEALRVSGERLDIANVGLSRIGVIQNTLEFEKQRINQQLRALELDKEKNRELIKQLNLSKQLLSERAGAEIDQLRLENLKAINEENQNIANTLAVAGLEGEERINRELEIQLGLLEAKKEQLRAEGLLTAEAEKALDARADLLRAGAQQQKNELPSAGMSIAQGILDADIGGLMGVAFGEQASGLIMSGLDTLGSVIGGAVSGVMTLFDPSFWENIGDTLTGLIDTIPDALLSIFEKLPQIFDDFIEKFPAVVDKILEALPVLIQSLLDKMPELIEMLFQSMGKLIDALPAMFQQLMDALPEILQSILDGLPEIIDKIFEALPQMINSLIRAIPGVIIQILESLPDIIESLVAGITGAMGEIAAQFIDTFIVQGGAIKIAIAFVKAMIRMVPAIISGLLKGLKRGFDALFKGIKLPVDLDVSQVEESFKSGLANVQRNVASATNQIFAVVDLNAQRRAQDQAEKLGAVIKNATDDHIRRTKSLWDKLKDIVAKAWKFVSDLWEALKGIVQAAWQFVLQLWEGLKGIVRAAWQFVLTLWDGLKAVVAKAWEFVQKLWDGLKEAVSSAWQFVQNIWDSLKGVVEGAFSFVKGIFDTFISAVKGTFERVVKPIFDALKSAFDGFKNVVNNLINNFNNIFRPVFDGLKNAFEAIKSPFNSLKDAMNAIKTPFETLANALNSFTSAGKGFLERLTGYQGGLVKANEIQRFQAGGNVLPFTSKGRDTVPALLAPGEFVINRNSVNSIGNNALKFMNETGKMPGGQVNNINMTVNVNVRANGNLTESEIKQRIVPTMKNELKKASLRGEFLISQRGVQ